MSAPSVTAMKLLMDPECKAKIREALEQGRSTLTAAKILGVSEKMIRNHIKADSSLVEGIILRPKGQHIKYDRD